MSTGLPPEPRPARLSFEAGPLLFFLGAGTALAVGLSFGFPTTDLRLLALSFIGVLVLGSALIWPMVALQAMLASIVMLIVWVVIDSKAANAIDLFLAPLLLASLLGGTRRRALAEDAALTDPAHGAIAMATRRLTRSVVVFYGLALLSLVALAIRGHPDWAFNSFQLLIRALQGVTFFALCTWWLRTDAHFRAALQAIQVGAWLLVAINLWFFTTAGIARAGMTWVVNDPEWPITSPNEAAVTLLFVIALVQSRPKEWRGPAHLLLVGFSIVMLILTQSRSGLLAWVIYTLLSVRWRWRTVLRSVVIGAVAMPLVPGFYWERLARTLAPNSSSFETFGSFIRLYGWQTAWRVFQDHPIFGVGYLSFSYISQNYNDFSLVLLVENFYFEVAVNMGIIGVIVLAVVLHALLTLARPIRGTAPEGTFGYELARRHLPLMLGLLAANLTGDNFMGMVGLAQLAVWCALLVRSGHLAVPRSLAVTAS